MEDDTIRHGDTAICSNKDTVMVVVMAQRRGWTNEPVGCSNGAVDDAGRLGGGMGLGFRVILNLNPNPRRPASGVSCTMNHA